MYVELMASCKKALSQMSFHKGKASALFPRTKMHTVDWRTMGVPQGGTRRTMRKSWLWRQTNYVEKKYTGKHCDNTTSRSCCCQKICSRGVDCCCGEVPLTYIPTNQLYLLWYIQDAFITPPPMNKIWVRVYRLLHKSFCMVMFKIFICLCLF